MVVPIKKPGVAMPGVSPNIGRLPPVPAGPMPGGTGNTMMRAGVPNVQAMIGGPAAAGMKSSGVSGPSPLLGTPPSSMPRGAPVPRPQPGVVGQGGGGPGPAPPPPQQVPPWGGPSGGGHVTGQFMRGQGTPGPAPTGGGGQMPPRPPGPAPTGGGGPGPAQMGGGGGAGAGGLGARYGGGQGSQAGGLTPGGGPLGTPPRGTGTQAQTAAGRRGQQLAQQAWQNFQGVRGQGNSLAAGALNQFGGGWTGQGLQGFMGGGQPLGGGNPNGQAGGNGLEGGRGGPRPTGGGRLGPPVAFAPPPNIGSGGAPEPPPSPPPPTQGTGQPTVGQSAGEPSYARSPMLNTGGPSGTGAVGDSYGYPSGYGISGEIPNDGPFATGSGNPPSGAGAVGDPYPNSGDPNLEGVGGNPYAQGQPPADGGSGGPSVEIPSPQGQGTKPPPTGPGAGMTGSGGGGPYPWPSPPGTGPTGSGSGGMGAASGNGAGPAGGGSGATGGWGDAFGGGGGLIYDGGGNVNPPFGGEPPRPPGPVNTGGGGGLIYDGGGNPRPEFSGGGGGVYGGGGYGGGYGQGGQAQNLGTTGSAQSHSENAGENTSHGESSGGSDSTSTSTGRSGSENQSSSGGSSFSDAKQTIGLGEVHGLLGSGPGREANAANPYTREQFAGQANRDNAVIDRAAQSQKEQILRKARASGLDVNSPAIQQQLSQIDQTRTAQHLENMNKQDAAFRQAEGQFNQQNVAQNIGQRAQDLQRMGLDANVINALLGQNVSGSQQQASSSGTSFGTQDAASAAKSWQQALNDAYGWNRGFSDMFSQNLPIIGWG